MTGGPAASPAAPAAPPLRAIAATLRGEGGLLAGTVGRDADRAAGPAADDALGRAVLAGPHGAAVGPALALAVEATREAELLHHAPERARVVRTADRDLALLAGDRLYALGIEVLAAEGRVAEVGLLAAVVDLLAREHAVAAWPLGAGHDAGTGDPDDAAGRTADVWAAAVRALGDGPGSGAAAGLRARAAGAAGDRAPHTDAATSTEP